MKIFVEADSIVTDRVSGIGHTTIEIIRAISKRIENTEHSLTIIVPYGKKPEIERYKFKNISVRSLPPLYRYVNYLAVRTPIPFPMDIIYGRGIYIFPNYKTWFLLTSQSLTFVHDVAYKILPDTINPANLRYLRKNMKRWLSRASKIITISESSKKDILKFFPYVSQKLEVVYLGVNQDEYRPRSSNEVKTALKKYGIDEKYFLYVGNIEPRKNIEKLLISYKTYADSVKNPVQIVLIGGGGWNDQSINDRIKSLIDAGYNILKPNQYVEDEDLPALYSGTEALLHISVHEGFGLSLVQAQACGAKIIASDLDVFRETLDERNVMYVDPQNTESISQAMTTVINGSHAKVVVSPPKHMWAQTATRLLRVAGIMVNDNDKK